MKSIGMVRPVDEMGRIVLPKELRRQFNIEDGEDSVEVFVDGDKIILKKYAPACIFCGDVENAQARKARRGGQAFHPVFPLTGCRCLQYTVAAS